MIVWINQIGMLVTRPLAYRVFVVAQSKEKDVDSPMLFKKKKGDP